MVKGTTNVLNSEIVVCEKQFEIFDRKEPLSPRKDGRSEI